MKQQTQKLNIFKLSIKDIKEILLSFGEKDFRAKQIDEWLWKKGVRCFDEMTNLSKHTRELLAEKLYIPELSIEHYQQSSDDTVKYAFKLEDGHLIEGVLIPSMDRTTACISTQVGCPLNCSFCATGQLGFIRNLEYYEIFDQVLSINSCSIKRFDKALSNIVIMGMGEPLLNYDNVNTAINLITGKKGLEMSPSRITLSTVGIIEGIKRMADEKLAVNLAISLHSAIQEKRISIIPAGKSNPLGKLRDALSYYYNKTGNRVTLEYLMLKGINDSEDDAKALAVFCKAFPTKINLIEYNEVEYTEFKRSLSKDIERFKSFLEQKNMVVTVRRSRGQDIDAGCGQLANKL